MTPMQTSQYQVHKDLPNFLVGTAATPGDPKSATITAVPTCSGTAMLTLIRGRQRFFFDLNVEVSE